MVLLSFLECIDVVQLACSVFYRERCNTIESRRSIMMMLVDDDVDDDDSHGHAAGGGGGGGGGGDQE